MKKLLIFLLFTSLTYSQTITFSGCVNLFDNQTFVFNKISTDVYGRTFTKPLQLMVHRNVAG